MKHLGARGRICLQFDMKVPSLSIKSAAFFREVKAYYIIPGNVHMHVRNTDPVFSPCLHIVI